MGSLSQASKKAALEAAPQDSSQATERAQRTSERRVPVTRETLATLPELPADEHFEGHDTIPAPPWLEELGEELSPLRESP